MPSDEIDLESGELEMKVHCKGESEKLCRICHLNFDIDGGVPPMDEYRDGSENGCGVEIELGCNCKGDLGVAHKKCAETWFKIKGNMYVSLNSLHFTLITVCQLHMISYEISRAS